MMALVPRYVRRLPPVARREQPGGWHGRWARGGDVQAFGPEILSLRIGKRTSTDTGPAGLRRMPTGGISTNKIAARAGLECFTQ
jgi:hypothetical protein